MNARGNQSLESMVKEIRGNTRRKYTAEEKARIVLEGLKGEVSIAELCRREGFVSNLYYRWSKDFLEAGKKRLAGDTAREATSSEVGGLRSENDQLKKLGGPSPPRAGWVSGTPITTLLSHGTPPRAKRLVGSSA